MINKKLIFQLSFFGLVMAFATLSLIPGKIELLVWLIIFILSAIAIGKRSQGKYFLHGFLLSLANGAWMTAAHILFFKMYIVNHMHEAFMLAKFNLSDYPRISMLFIGLILSMLSGCILGLFAMAAARLDGKKIS